MKFERLVFIALSYCALIIWGVNQKTLTTKVMETSNEQQKYDGPEQFAEFHRAIRTAEGATGPEYKPGYKVQELVKARTFFQSRKGSGDRFLSGGTVVWTERGPSNVPGRTRGLIVDPDDPGNSQVHFSPASSINWQTPRNRWISSISSLERENSRRIRGISFFGFSGSRYRIAVNPLSRWA